MGFSVFPAPSSGLSASDLVASPKYEVIGTYTSTTNVADITFNSIPQTYRKLVIAVPYLWYDQGSSYFIQLKLNGSAADIHRYGVTYIDSTTTPFLIPNGTTSVIHHRTIQANNYWTGRIEIENYALSDTSKLVRMVGNHYSQNEGRWVTTDQQGVTNGATFEAATTSLSLSYANGLNTNNKKIVLYGVI